MCTETGHVIPNLVSLSPGRLLLEFCSEKSICSKNFKIIIIKENRVKMLFPISKDTIKGCVRYIFAILFFMSKREHL